MSSAALLIKESNVLLLLDLVRRVCSRLAYDGGQSDYSHSGFGFQLGCSVSTHAWMLRCRGMLSLQPTTC